jgi:hypothetical protein
MYQMKINGKSAAMKSFLVPFISGAKVAIFLRTAKQFN